jgi:hypothetical protein
MAIVEVYLNATDVRRFEADGWTLENDEPRATVLAVYRRLPDESQEVGFRVRAGEFSSVNFLEGEPQPGTETEDWTPLPASTILPSGLVVLPADAFGPVTPPAEPPPAEKPSSKATKEA